MDSSFNPTLLELQYFQELHDKQYHVDIYSKSLMARLTHLHQHLIKYSKSSYDRFHTRSKAIACILSMANSINLNLSDSLTSTYKVLKLTENGVDTLCICVNGIYYTSYYLSSRCILIEKKDGTLVNHGHSFNTKGNTI